MNKEEIENKKKMLRDFSEEGQGQRVFFEEDLKLIRDILKELEQKESILDKVTDKLKEDIENDYCIKEYTRNEYGITGTTSYSVKPYARELLKFIEGEKNERK